MDSEYISKKEIYDCLDKLESIAGTSREWEDRDQVVMSTVKAVAKAVRAIVGLAKEQDVVPVKRGRWLSMDSEKAVTMSDDGCPVDSCCCSECGDWLTGSDEYAVRGRYCPNCGARMDKDGGAE